LQTPPAQVSVVKGSHAMHAPPLMPHVDSDGAWQVDPEQHPLGHDVASHTHAPPAQR